MQTKVKTILATIENKSSISPATKELHNIQHAAQTMIDQSIQANKQTEKDIMEYDTFIQNLKEQKTVLVANTTNATTLTSPLLHIDNHSKTIIQNQEDPNKSYLSLNKTMVDGYLKAIQTDGPEKLNMTQSTYDKSKTYLETTKNKIDTALLAYNDQQTFVAASTCTTCTDSEEAANTYTTDMSAYVQGVFIESYSGTDKSMINTLVSTQQTQQVQNKYSTNIDLNNDQNPDILMYDTNTIYIKYANQQTQQLSE